MIKIKFTPKEANLFPVIPFKLNEYFTKAEKQIRINTINDNFRKIGDIVSAVGKDSIIKIKP